MAICAVQSHHFPALQLVGLDPRICGASELKRVHHAPAAMRARHRVMRQSTEETPAFPFMLHLSEDSPDYHERIEQRLHASERDPPFSIESAVAGSRRGWRWSNHLGGCCDVRWLDPEPAVDAEDCEACRQELAELQAECADSTFLSFSDPPTPEEHARLCLQK